MANYYVKGQSGSNGGAGTSASPWLTLAFMIATVGTPAPGSTVYVAEDFLESANTISSWDRVTIQQWPGETQARFLGGTVLPSSGWTNTAGTVWEQNIGAGLSIGRITSKWRARSDSNGRYGSYAKQANAAAVSGVNFSWFYDSGTGVLTINISTDPSPNGGTGAEYMRVVENTHVLRMQSCTSCAVNGVDWGLSAGTGAGSYLFYGDGTGNRLINCRFYDGGAHAVTWGVGTNVDNWCVHCEFSGGEDVSTQGAHYCSTTNVTSCGYSDCDFIMTSNRGPDALPISTSHSVSGMYAHTQGLGSGNEVIPGGIELRRCRFTRPFGNPGYAISHGNSAEVTANSTNPTDYPVFADRCTVSDALETSGFRTLYRNCSFIKADAVSSNNVPLMGVAAATYGKNQLCLIGCHIVRNLYASAGNERSIFYCRNTDSSDYTKLILINNTIVDVQSTDAWWPRVVTWSGGGSAGSLYMRGNVIAGKQGAGTKGLTMFYGDDLMTDFDCDGNWWWGEDSGYSNCFSGRTARKDLSAWSGVFTTGNGSKYSTNPNLASPTTSAVPTVGGNLDTTRLRLAVHTLVGINGRPYGGQYGAYQKGGSAAGLWDLIGAAA